jgi:cystathionine gamma-synthase
MSSFGSRKAISLVRRSSLLSPPRWAERECWLGRRALTTHKDNPPLDDETASAWNVAQQAGREAAALAAQHCRTSATPPNLSTRLAHAGVVGPHKAYPTNTPLAPPLHLATTYSRAADGEYHGPTDAIYSRMDNPTRRLLEQEIDCMERQSLGLLSEDENHDNDDKGGGGGGTTTTSCLATTAWSSGLAAVTGLVLAHQAPLTVLLPADLYHGTYSLWTNVFTRFGVTVQRVDWRRVQFAADGGNDNHGESSKRMLAQITESIPTDHDVIVWLETPSNPLCHVLDIEAISTWAHTHGKEGTEQHAPAVTVVVDSTLAPSPLVQQPLRHGADVVLQSATKYLAGHSDATIGILTANPTTTAGRRLAQALPTVQALTGAVASAMDAWLCLRGLRTLHVRVPQQCATAQRVAEWLQGQPGVSRVHYPGLASHPSVAVAQRQMKEGCYGGVLSVDMGTASRALAVAAALTTIQRATSLGGTETLVEHRASIEPPDNVTSPPGLLRLSVGLEHPNDLLVDLARALEIANKVCGCPENE